jgi:tetratricopeptide (TPR) repeat protein
MGHAVSSSFPAVLFLWNSFGYFLLPRGVSMRKFVGVGLALGFSLIAFNARSQGVTCPTPKAVSSAADQAFAAGDFMGAEKLFSSQLAGASDTTNYVGLVRAQLEQNKLADALASAQRAVAAFPKSADSLALMGDVMLRSGQVPEASEAYTKAISMDPCSARAHFGLGRAEDLVGRHLAAAKQFSLAHRLAPSDAEMVAALFPMAGVDQRLPALRNFLAGHPALPPARLEKLNTDLAVLEQHANCHTEAFKTAQMTLDPIFQNGRYRRSWGLKTRVNDANLPLLELDSSVDGIVLNMDDAAKAHVHPLIAGKVSTTAPYVGVADEIHVGDLSYRNCPVTVVPNSALDDHNSLIGTSFFRDHLIHIDYVAYTLKLTPLPTPPTGEAMLTDQFIAPEESDWSPVYVAGPNVLLPTLINKKGPFLFALDTGTTKTILSPAVAASQLSVGKDTTINLKGVSGRVVKVIARDGGGVTDVTDVRDSNGKLLPVSRPVGLPVLRFTKNEIPDDSAVSFDISTMSHADGVEISGLLGFHILSYYSLDLNYRDGLAQVLFDQNRRYHVRENDLGY